jgi:hypothetical protein
LGLPHLTGKSLTTKDTKYTKGEKSLDFVGFSFVTVVSFVFEKWHPVKNGRADFFFFGNEQETNPWSIWIEGVPGYQGLSIIRDWRFTAALWNRMKGSSSADSIPTRPPTSLPKRGFM